MSRAEFQRVAPPQLTAEVRMYETAEGGLESPAQPGWTCPVMTETTKPLVGWDALPLLRDAPLHPGETRELGFVFLSGDAAVRALREAGHFYLWEGRFIGEGRVID
ncbi:MULTISPECIES: hypothetical protein [unclassified Sphingomonas]|uniref:hypothetical protein n=1 Tax=unclassified Sphingomonas TaxID=196159 RepID=UPI0022B3DAE9|nr:hypothetical protein [Sphingomonas sp. NIBR02145]WHU05062.1 hypothetical protein O3305_10875 [Sphingomonas sp. NIBR02145]